VTPRPAVLLYTREGCHLCDVARGILERVGRRVPFDLTVIDVDGDPRLAREHGEDVPVVFVNGRKTFAYRVDPGELERALREA
jgi:glutaredoxin